LPLDIDQSIQNHYLKINAVHDEHICTSRLNNRQQVARIVFRNGIKKRNKKKLQQSQGLLQNTNAF